MLGEPGSEDDHGALPNPGVGSAGGPGLAKARARPLTWRSARFAALSVDFWQRVVESADVVSEGEVVSEEARSVYYGTTLLVCDLRLFAALGGPGAPPPEDDAAWCALLAADAHVRLRLLRIAHREASARAPRQLGVLHAELSVALRGRQLRMELAVSAPLAELADARGRGRPRT